MNQGRLHMRNITHCILLQLLSCEEDMNEWQSLKQQFRKLQDLDHDAFWFKNKAVKSY